MMMQQEEHSLLDAAQHTHLDAMDQLLRKGLDPEGDIGGSEVH